MATKKKLLQAAAGQAGGGGLNVEEVFSTYLYTGTSANRSINNGIDLSTEGGAVWFKGRTSAYNHILYDTERGALEVLRPNRTNSSSQLFGSNGLTSFNTNGFSITGGNGELNLSGQDYASWTWRKAPRFFDCVTYTGNGSNRTISHNLGTTPGMIIVKETSGTTSWRIWHRSLGNNQYIRFQTDAANADSSYSHWSSTAHTDTTFSVGTNVGTNNSGSTYVAYLFAHNDGDGEFGPDGDADIIKCGSYTGNGSTDGPEIDLGFEPQWLLVKNASASANWRLVDTMRGFDYSDARSLYPNLSAAEGNFNQPVIVPTPTGFKLVYAGLTDFNASGNTYIYIAIRRGPMAVPESATDVFAINSAGTQSSPDPWYVSDFPVDMAWYKGTNDTSNHKLYSRLTQGKYLITNGTNAEATDNSGQFDFQDGWYNNSGTYTDYYSWMWRRAPNFFDVVAYTGNGTAGHTVSHNLGVAPEMMWVKQRNAAASWRVYHSAIGNTGGLTLNLTNASFTLSTIWNNTSPTATDFTLGTYGEVNTSGNTYIAYLFASLDGVSKVGSYTGDGSTDGSKVIDCGFSSGARFVLIKRTDNVGSWYVWDTERGIVVGNDPILQLNSTAAEVTASDDLVPSSSGFAVKNSGASVNINSATYIFYAIA